MSNQYISRTNITLQSRSSITPPSQSPSNHHTNTCSKSKAYIDKDASITYFTMNDEAIVIDVFAHNQSYYELPKQSKHKC